MQVIQSNHGDEVTVRCEILKKYLPFDGKNVRVKDAGGWEASNKKAERIRGAAASEFPAWSYHLESLTPGSEPKPGRRHPVLRRHHHYQRGPKLLRRCVSALGCLFSPSPTRD